MKWFHTLAQTCAEIAGSAKAFVFTLAALIAWFAFGPVSGWSDSWQLVANTSTTIATTLLVLLVQHTQSSDTKAIHLKLNEIVKAIEGADNRLIGIESRERDGDR